MHSALENAGVEVGQTPLCWALAAIPGRMGEGMAGYRGGLLHPHNFLISVGEVGISCPKD